MFQFLYGICWATRTLHKLADVVGSNILEDSVQLIGSGRVF